MVESQSVSDIAPTISIGTQTLQSVEYPGAIGPSPKSLQKALRTLGKQGDWDKTFNKETTNLELRFRPENRWAHPVIGDRVQCHRLLMKVTRRRRKRRTTTEQGVQEGQEEEDGGVYKVDVRGVIKQTVRYRAMADYQYQPSPDNEIVKLIEGLQNVDYDTISNFNFKPLDENYIEPIVPTGTPLVTEAEATVNSSTKGDETSLEWDDQIKYRSLFNAFPPPVFSIQAIPPIFTYEHNIQSKLEPYTNPVTGEETYRYVNKQKNIFYNFRTMHHMDQGVPTEPPADVKSALPHIDQAVLAITRQKFDQRPMWTRGSIHNQFDEEIRRMFQLKHAFLPSVAYIILDGPFRDNLIKIGYDPRTDPSVYLYQRIYFRNMKEERAHQGTMSKATGQDRHYGPRDSQWQAEKLKGLYGEDFEVDPLKSHIFDGKVLHRDIANYQLCDVTDPLLAKLIRDPRALSNTLHDQTGWYKPRQFYAIKAILRLKWQALIDGKEHSAEKVAEHVAQFYEYDNANLPADLETEVGDELYDLESALAQKKKVRKSRAQQETLDEVALNSTNFRGPLSSAAQREQRLRGAAGRARGKVAEDVDMDASEEGEVDDEEEDEEQD